MKNFFVWKAVSAAFFNVGQAFHFSPDEESGAATSIPFSYAGLCCYLGLHDVYVYLPLNIKPDKTKSPERGIPIHREGLEVIAGLLPPQAQNCSFPKPLYQLFRIFRLAATF